MRSTGFNANGGADVLPYFINSNFHPILSAIFLAFILFIILGTASGLVVGVVTNIFSDFFITAKKGLLSLNEKKEMYIVRLVNFTVVFTGYFIVAIGKNTTMFVMVEARTAIATSEVPETMA